MAFLAAKAAAAGGMDFSALSDGRALMRRAPAERQARRVKRRSRSAAAHRLSTTSACPMPGGGGGGGAAAATAAVEAVELSAEELERRYNRRMSAFLDFHTPSDHESDCELERPITAIGNFAFDVNVMRVHRRLVSTEAESQIYDHTGRTLYLDLCKKAGVVPTGYFLRHMADDVLDLRHHGLCAAGIKPICGSLVNNCHVTSLDLSDNWLGNAGGRAVIEMMSENCFISTLVLRDNKLSLEIAENLAAVLTSNQQLTHLDLSGNEFCDKAALFLADMLASSPRLLYLNLSNNNFGEEGGYLFGKAIGENSTMLELDLSWNHIRTKGCKAIANGLAQNSCLKKFNVSWNGFGPVYGAQELGKALKANTCLEELDISTNRIVPEGAVLIGKGLSLNTKLQVLKMGKNPIQTAGCYAILNAVLKNYENTALQKIMFHDIKVNNDFKELQLLARELLPNLTVELGYKPPLRPKVTAHPMIRLKRFIERHSIRLIDFFNKIDSDQSMSVTREEFVAGLEEYGLSFTEEDMEMLMTALDKDGDGTVNYSELVLSNNEYTELEKKQDQQVAAITVT